MDDHDDEYLSDLDLYVENGFEVPRASTYGIELEARVRATLALERIASVLSEG